MLKKYCDRCTKQIKDGDKWGKLQPFGQLLRETHEQDKGIDLCEGLEFTPLVAVFDLFMCFA